MNMETSDHELLKRFVKDQSEPAFRRMVDRHLNLVFATARRIVGSPHLAEEVAQGVFMLLARKAGEIQPHQPLAGWLYHTARHHSLNVTRAEGRRRQREHTAAIAMETNAPQPEPAWIAAELEDAMDDLPNEDRDALVLRFLDNRPLREVGTELGISEEAARKRVGRALEKLRGIFGKRGVALSAGLLSTTLTGQAATVAPAALGATITATALSQLAAVSTATIATIHTTSIMTTLFNLKTAAVVLGVAAVTGTSTYLAKENEADRLRAENRTLNQNYTGLTAKQQQAMSEIQLRDKEIARLKKDIADLPRLRGEVDRLTRKLAEHEAIAEENRLLQARLADVQNRLRELEEARLRTGAASTREQDDDNAEPTRLFTRSYRVSITALGETLRTTGLNLAGVDMNFRLREYLSRKAGIQLEPPKMMYLNEEAGTLLVRTDLETLETLQHIIEAMNISSERGIE